MILTTILKIALATLKMEKMRWLTRKYLLEMFEEHILKVSYLYPEVQDCLKILTFPSPLVNMFTALKGFQFYFLSVNGHIDMISDLPSLFGFILW